MKTREKTGSRTVTAARKRVWKRSIPLYLMLLLPIAYYLIFCYGPMFGVTIAFKDFNAYTGFASPWATDRDGALDLFKHFKAFLTDDYFWKIFVNTLRCGTVNTLFCFTCPIILALLFNELIGTRYKKVMQTMSYLPYFVSTVAIVNIMVIMLSQTDGIVNEILEEIGIGRINFLLSPKWFLPMYVTMNLWRSVGWGTIIYIASMSNIDTQLYEAADLEGATRLQKIWHITLPAIRPTIIILFIMAVPGLIGADFEAILLLQKEQIMSVADVVPTYMYRRGILENSADFATAIGLFFSVVNIIMIMITNHISQKVSEVSLF